MCLRLGEEHEQNGKGGERVVGPSAWRGGKCGCQNPARSQVEAGLKRVIRSLGIILSYGDSLPATSYK